MRFASTRLENEFGCVLHFGNHPILVDLIRVKFAILRGIDILRSRSWSRALLLLRVNHPVANFVRFSHTTDAYSSHRLTTHLPTHGSEPTSLSNLLSLDCSENQRSTFQYLHLMGYLMEWTSVRPIAFRKDGIVRL